MSTSSLTTTAEELITINDANGHDNVTTVDKPLVLPEDKPEIAEFLYVVMGQVQPCRFTEADRNKRRLKDVGCIGVECKHCAGQVDSRKFFWSSVNAVVSNFVSVHTHMMECRMIPREIKESLAELKKLRKEQTAALKTGSQKSFFGRVWKRLHEEPKQQEEGEGVKGANESKEKPAVSEVIVDEIDPVKHSFSISLSQDTITTTNNDEDSTGGIATPHDHDVLSGCGDTVNRHPGNEYFRSLVQHHKLEYYICSKHTQKKDFMKLIVSTIRDREPPGRFLKQDGSSKLWYNISTKNVLTKTKRALQYRETDRYKATSTSPSGNNNNEMSSLSSKTSLHPPSYKTNVRRNNNTTTTTVGIAVAGSKLETDTEEEEDDDDNDDEEGKDSKRPRKEGDPSTKWHQDDLDLLKKLVKNNKDSAPRWNEIAANFSNSTAIDCLTKWQTITNPPVTKGKGSWIAEEDAILREKLRQYGRKWKKIAAYLPRRSNKQCRERFVNHLDPELKKGEWTDDEEAILIAMHELHGNRWANISKQLPGRSDNDVKNHYWFNSNNKKRLFDDIANVAAATVAAPTKKPPPPPSTTTTTTIKTKTTAPTKSTTTSNMSSSSSSSTLSSLTANDKKGNNGGGGGGGTPSSSSTLSSTLSTLSSSSTSSSSSSSNNDLQRSSQFPFRLHNMLDDAERTGHSHIVSWSPGGESFKIHLPKQLINVVQQYFRQSKLTSFLRQLQWYDFKRTTRGIDQGVVSHPMFLRGRRSACTLMKRNVAVASAATKIAVALAAKNIQRAEEEEQKENISVALAAGFLRAEKNIKIQKQVESEEKAKQEVERKERAEADKIQKQVESEEKAKQKVERKDMKRKRAEADKIQKQVESEEKAKQKVERKERAEADKIQKQVESEEKAKQKVERKDMKRKRAEADKIEKAERKVERKDKKRKRVEADKIQKQVEREEKKVLRKKRKKKKKKQDKAKRKSKRKEYKKKTKLHKDGIKLITGNDPEVDRINTLRNQVKDFVEESAGKPEGLSRVCAKDGTDMSPNGFFKFKAYGEAKTNSILDECNSTKNCVYRNPLAATSSVQAVGEYSADTKQLPPFLAKRVEVAKTGTFFGKIKAITDNLKLQKYIDLEAATSHKDNRFRHNLKKPDFDLPDKSFLLARVLEKPAGGDLEWVSKKDKKVFLIPIEKGELLIMMAHAGLCTHKCHDGLYTIVTDFVLPYEAHREMKINRGLKGKFEKFIVDFASHL